MNHKSFMHFKGSYGTKKPNAPKRTVTFETESEQEWVESNPSDVDKPKNGKKTIIKNEQAIKTEPISPQEMEVYQPENLLTYADQIEAICQKLPDFDSTNSLIQAIESNENFNNS